MLPGHFTTKRLCVGDWRPAVDNPEARRGLESDLSVMLTPAVLDHLPASMQLADRPDRLAVWVEARVAESDVLLVRRQHDNQLIGLMIVAANPDAGVRPAFHIGYLIAESAWGHGYASELLGGFIQALTTGDAVRLVAGVEYRNPASARVLQKSGFAQQPESGTATTEMYVLDID